MNHRRNLLIVLGTGALVNPLAGALTAQAQQPPAKPRRIGYLTLGSAESNAHYLVGFRAGMAALQWVDGRDYVIEPRYANGVAQAVTALAVELVAQQPDLILTAGDGSLRALLQQTKTIPVVMGIAQDPVGSGLVASLRRPGGNATGLTSLAGGLGSKRMQILKDAFPRLAHIAVLYEPENPGGVAQWKEIEEAAKHLKLRATPHEVRQPADIAPAFKRGTAQGVQAWLIAQGGPQITHRKEIAERAIALKLPVMATNVETTEAGGLMSYGASVTDNFRRAAGYVDKIFKGAKPGELPMQQPVTFEFVVNLKTAKAIGITVPPIVMLQANRVIE